METKVNCGSDKRIYNFYPSVDVDEKSDANRKLQPQDVLPCYVADKVWQFVINLFILVRKG